MPQPWNKDRSVGRKPPLTRTQVHKVRRLLKRRGADRDLALFNLAIDSKLVAIDLLHLRRRDVTRDNRLLMRAVVETARRKQFEFEISPETQAALITWINTGKIADDDYLFQSRVSRSTSKPMSVRQFNRVLAHWLSDIGLDPALYGTQSLRRTKAMMIYEQTGDISVVKKLLGHRRARTTVNYLGIGDEPVDAVAIAQRFKI